MDHPKEEKTVVIIKPDGVKRGLVGEIIGRIEQRGLKIISIEMIETDRKIMDKHYPKDTRWISRLGEKTLSVFNKYGLDIRKEMGTDDVYKIGKEVRDWILDYMVSGPLVKMIVKGIHAIDMMRKLCGNSLPNLAEMGTIRGDYSVDSPAAANRDKRAIHNIIHASETPQEAANELKLWFRDDEIHDYERTDESIMF
jgi:nucleoside-diphosphate kinase